MGIATLSRLLPTALLTAACVEPVYHWEGPEDDLVDTWFQNIDTNRPEYEGTCAQLQLDGEAYALVPSQQWMFRARWSAGGPGVIDLLSGQLKLGHIDIERRDDELWHARYSGMLLGGMEAWIVPGCDQFDLSLIDLD